MIDKNTTAITDDMINRALGEYERPRRAAEEVVCDCCGELADAELVQHLPEEYGGLDVCPVCMDLCPDKVMDKIYKKLDRGVKAEMLEWLLEQ